jgi:hypothetical protein
MDVFNGSSWLQAAHSGPTPSLLPHLEKKKKCELLDVVAVKQVVIPQDIAVIPNFWTRAGAVMRDLLFPR